MTEAQSNEWQNSKSRRRERKKRQQRKTDGTEAEEADPFEAVKKRFGEARQLVDESLLSVRVGKEIRDILSIIRLGDSEHTVLASSICLGLGSLADSRDARLQLALWLSVLKEVAAADIAGSTLPLLLMASDPAFTPEDQRLLGSLGVDVVDPAAAKSRFSTLPLPCLAYLPHAPNFVVNNFLYENWNDRRLPGLLLLGNSLPSLSTNLSAPVLRHLGYVESGAKFCRECETCLTSRGQEFFTAFNDVSLQWFPTVDRAVIDEAKMRLGEPVYAHADDRMKDLLGFSRTG